MDTVITREGNQPEEAKPGDFYVIISEYGTWYVTSEQAGRIGRVLGRSWRIPRWLRFVDVSGSRVWLRASSIESVYECSAEIRERDRHFHYLRRKETRESRRWDDDE